ncbi:MAG TPA: hypothetical protein VHC96_18295 [Puia sp.]|jgi:hypothetical protein|nr:hypothetical protein [Puia sp.]
MKHLLSILTIWTSIAVQAQVDWPHTIIGSDGGIFYVYQPQPDSFSENLLRFKAAFTYLGKGNGESRYGSFQALAIVDIDKDRRKMGVLLANILFLAVSGPPDAALTDYLKETLECGMPAAALDISLDDLVCSLQLSCNENSGIIGALRNDPPRIIIATKPSVLVFIDGPPKMRRHAAWGVNMVVNTPNIIMESFDGWFYLYGGRHWYIGPEATGPFNYTGYIAPDIQRVQRAFASTMAAESEHTDTVREGTGIVEDIIVCTSPAELIQTRGKPVYQGIPGTRLQYVTNSNNDIFRDSVQQQYYMLLSGRWYTSGGLEGPWNYIPAGKLPADLGKIPEGSPKDNVLASLAGTTAAREAVTDALVPQTAIISRHSITPAVTYDGTPRFRDIPGTHLQYALNTAGVVLKEKDQYYCLEKGVWFFGSRPSGPWAVCTERPAEVDRIPVECPVYFCRYVHIYGASSDYIYTGYTSGYLNAYVSGPGVVYGTGWTYPSWKGNSYYPRAWTWGFNMRYNPWFGWCLGSDLDPGWFNSCLDDEHQKAGWWGAGYYLPSYIWHHFSGHGLYERDIRRVENISYINNLYSLRPDHVTRQAAVPLYTDSLGEVFMHKEGAGWMRREGGQWTPVDNPGQQARLSSIEAWQQRSLMRQRNFLRQRGG